MTNKTTEEISTIVHAALDAVEVDDKMPDAAPIRVRVKDESIERSLYSWRVQVQPSREPRRWSYLYEELAIVSEAIAEKAGVNVIFTTLDPANAPGVAA